MSPGPETSPILFPDSPPRPQLRGREVSGSVKLTDLLARLGKGPHRHETAFAISRYFAPGRQEQSITFDRLYEGILRMAAGYRSLGLGRGAKIAIAETNTVDFFTSYFGGLAIGATMVPMNLLALQDESSKTLRLTHMLGTPKLHASDTPGVDAYIFGEDPMFAKMHGLKKVLKLKKLKPLLTPVLKRFGENASPHLWEKPLFSLLGKNAKTPREKQDLWTLFERLPEAMRVISPEDKQALMAAHPHPPDTRIPLSDEQVADIVFTSGTSGNPKGVALTHGNLAFTVKSLTDATEGIIQDGDVLLMGLPFFHIFGKAVMLTAFSRQQALSEHGGKVGIVLLPSLSKAVQNLDGILKTIQDYRVTILPAVPVFLEKLAETLERHPEKKPMVRTLKIIISGGAALKLETYNAFKAINPDIVLMEGYGSSEAGINLLNTQDVSGYVGHPLPGVETALIPDAENMEKGELLVRSPGVSHGYVEGTVERHGSGKADLTIAGPGGWFRTGDIVRMEPGNGYKIIGRDSFFIKIDNEKRSPGEIEEAVLLAHPAIKDVMVVARHAGTIQEHAVALVVSEDPEVSEGAIKQSMDKLAQKSMITRWKIPKHIVVLHQPRMPERFDNGFKRDAGYKVIRQFIQELEALKNDSGEPAILFHPRSETCKREWTEIFDLEIFQSCVDRYN